MRRGESESTKKLVEGGVGEGGGLKSSFVFVPGVQHYRHPTTEPAVAEASHRAVPPYFLSPPPSATAGGGFFSRSRHQIRGSVARNKTDGSH